MIRALGALLAGLLLLPVLVIGAATGGLGSMASTSAGGGGDPAELAEAVLSDPAIALTGAARADISSGSADPRLLAVLLVLAETHELAPVGPLATGHRYFVAGTTRASNHVFGRAVDISGVDGAAVSPANQAAREVIEELLALDPPLAPDEVGGPWVVSAGARRSFSDADHQGHIHIGWDAKLG